MRRTIAANPSMTGALQVLPNHEVTQP